MCSNWKVITCTAWINNIKATIGGIGVLIISKEASTYFLNVEKIPQRIIIATFQGNPVITIISCK